MQSLKDTINENLALSELDSFDNEVLSHISIEYFENYYAYMKHLVFEKYGVYDGLTELCKIISNDIDDERVLKDRKAFTLNYSKEELDDLPNVFFDELLINVNIINKKEEPTGSYTTDYSKLNKEKLFDKVVINLSVRHGTDAHKILMHELTHAYEYWNRLIKGDTYIQDIFKSNFYKGLMPTDNDTEFSWYTKIVLYLTLGIEQNAFVTELTHELHQHQNEIKTPLDALSILKQSGIYQTYKFLYTKLIGYTNKTADEKWIRQITDTYNQLSNTNWSSEKVIKKLKHLIQKSLKKFDNIIGKLCVDSLNNPSYFIDFFDHSKKIERLKNMP